MQILPMTCAGTVERDQKWSAILPSLCLWGAPLEPAQGVSRQSSITTHSGIHQMLWVYSAGSSEVAFARMEWSRVDGRKG